MRVTLQHIADRLNVHVTAVSVVLNERSSKTSVSKELREKILRTASEMNYIPNAAARQLRGKSLKVIGIVTPNWRHHTGTDLRRFISEILYEHGYQALLGIVMDDLSNLDAVIRDMISRNVNGIIVPCAWECIDPARYPIPLLVVADKRDAAEKSQFMIDRVAGMRLATEHLLEHGHKKIGYIDQRDWPEKFAGYTEALQNAGITPPDCWHIQCFRNPSFREEVEFLLKKEKVTAFVCTNDFYAARFIRYLQLHGYSVPGDVAVIGYDGSSLCDCITPSLTTVVTPNLLFAKKLVSRMIRMVEHPSPKDKNPELELLTPYLSFGRSCGCKPKEADLVCWNAQGLSRELYLLTEREIPEKFYTFDKSKNKESFKN